MRFIDSLTSDERAQLKRLWKTAAPPRVRQRAHAVLLSYKGYKIDMLADIFDVDRDTISAWFDRWDKHGGDTDGAKAPPEVRLEDAPRSGRPRKIKAADEPDVLKMVGANPRQLKTVMASIEERLQVSLDTIKRLLRRRGWRWRRIRRSLKSRRDEAAFRKAQAELEQLKRQEDAGLLDLIYFDAAGFSLEPACPYAWQPPGQPTTSVASQKTRRINVLGFMQRSLRFTPFVVEGSICSQTVIACIDAFAKTEISKGLRRQTVLVLDNAPVHTSKAFEKARRRWLGKGLVVKHLPSYSPELNLIERLWQEIKYRWLPFWAYESRKTLAEALEDILVGIGEKYRITFA